MSSQRPTRRRMPQLPLPAFDQMAERRIREAQDNGAFDDLPGAGAPLKLDDDALVPEELRAAYRVLKNSGYVPSEVEALRELHEVEQQLERERDETRRTELLGKLNLLLARAGLSGERNLALEHEYFCKIAEKLGARGSRQR